MFFISITDVNFTRFSPKLKKGHSDSPDCFFVDQLNAQVSPVASFFDQRDNAPQRHLEEEQKPL